jgi:polyhydroxyalkanoate synthesis regulator protein
MKETLVRYSNRKTYSTTQKKYVNLKYLLQKLQADEEFVVTEHKTGADITAKTMRQAVASSDLTLEQIKKALR